MYFKNDHHKMLFEEFQASTGVKADREYAAAAYLLAATEKPAVKTYISRSRINFVGINKIAEPWSTSEKALIDLAANIFTDGGYPAHVNEVFRYLGTENVRVVIEGLQIRYGGR